MINSVIHDSDASISEIIESRTITLAISCLVWTLECKLASLITTNQCLCPGPVVCLPPLQPRGRASGDLQPSASTVGVYYWKKIYQSNPILIHLTSLTSICIGQGVWKEGWVTVPRRWQGSPWGSWPTSPWRTSKEGEEQEFESDATIPQSRLLSV